MDLTQYQKVWFTSDLHFSHKNIMKFCPNTRPYRDIREMNEHLIEIWNSSVGFQDIVFIIGDFSFGTEEESIKFLSRLNGTKVLVVGNHDEKMVRNSANFRAQFAMVKDYVKINIEGIKIVMFHFPVWEWDSMQRGSIHLHGHVHGAKTGIPGRILDVGYDAHCKLLTWDDVKRKMLPLPIREH